MKQKSLGSSQDAGKQLQKSHWARVIRGRDTYSDTTPAKHCSSLENDREGWRMNMEYICKEQNNRIC